MQKKVYFEDELESLPVAGSEEFLLEQAQVPESTAYLIKQAGILAELALDAEKKKQAADLAKEKYEFFAKKTLPDQFRLNGFTEVRLENGAYARLLKKCYCSPNKNLPDKRVIAEWLRQNNGDSIVKDKLVVEPSEEAKQLLKQYAVPYSEDVDINTNSLKSFIRSALGIGEKIVPKIKEEDVPVQAHFYTEDIVEISL